MINQLPDQAKREPVRAASTASSSSASSSSSSRSSSEVPTADAPSRSSSSSRTSSSSSRSSSSASSISTAPPPPSAAPPHVVVPPSPPPVQSRKLESLPTPPDTSVDRRAGRRGRRARLLPRTPFGRVRGTDSREEVRARLQALVTPHAPAFAGLFPVQAPGESRGDESAEATLQPRLDYLTAQWMAQAEAAGLASRALQQDKQTGMRSLQSSAGPSEAASDVFYVWLDGFKTAVCAESRCVCPRTLFHTLAARQPDESGVLSSASPPVLLFDCTRPLCHQRARRELVEEVDSTMAAVAEALTKARRKVEAGRNSYRRAQSLASAASQASQASQTAPPLTVMALPMPLDESAELGLEASLFDGRRKRARSSTVKPDTVGHAPPTPLDDVTTTYARLQELRETVHCWDEAVRETRRLHRHVHRAEWLTGSNVNDSATTALLTNAHGEGVLLLPHPVTGLVTLEPGHHYRLVKFVGAHLVLAGHWEPIPLAPTDDLCGPGLDRSPHQPPVLAEARPLRLAPADNGACAAGLACLPPMDKAAVSVEVQQQQHWARRELAAVLLFLRKHGDQTASDFFSLVPEEAAMYVTAAAEKGWYPH